MHMDAQDHLRQTIDQQMHHLRASIPHEREGAILALLHQQDRLPRTLAVEPLPDLVTGHHLSNLGGNLALRLCLESTSDGFGTSPPADSDDLKDWATRFLHECDRLAEAEMVLNHVETGFMRLVNDGAGTIAAWIATKHAPTR